MSGFLHECKYLGPCAIPQNIYEKYFVFRGDIREYISDFRVTLPGSHNDP